jgi:hypothetical protein
MDFSKLSSNEKMVTYGAVAVVVAGIISNWGGLLWLSILAAIAALVVVFLPQISASTQLPGSKGSLLVALGGIAAAGAVIEILRYIGYFFDTLGFYQTWLFAIALIGSLVMAWAGWQEFQGEGATFKIGTSGSARPPSPTMSGPMVPPPGSSGRSESMGPPGMTEPTPPPPASTPPPPASTNTDDEAR